MVYAPAGDDRVGRLTLTRPAKLNATDDRTLRDLEAAVEEASGDDRARAVVVAGQGRAFCVGIDLRALAHDELPADWYRRWDRTLARLEALPAPTVAAIQGPCLGGGVQIALCCDFRLAAAGASFALSAVRHGLLPGLATYRLPRFIGMGRARAMMLSGETWEAERAAACGLVDRLVPDSELEAAARELAADLATAPRGAVRDTKRMVLAAFDLPFEEFLRRYLEAQERSLADGETRSHLESYRKGRWR